MFRLQTRKPPAQRPIDSFDFLDATRQFTLVDAELELVEPEERHIDGLLAACHHPLTRKDMPVQAKTTRDTLLSFLAQNPRGHWSSDSPGNNVPAYTFWMRLRTLPPDPRLPPLPVSFAGSISLRIGHNANLDLYLGHLGYHVLPPARGHHYAERACRLLLPLASAHGHRHLWITCNPDNLASRRTIERLGASLISIVSVPRDNPLHSQGDRQKCRYRLDL